MGDLSYGDFITKKTDFDVTTGLTEIPELPDCLFDFQSDIVKWALRRGRAALFAGTGLGKTLMALAWADAVYRSTGQNIIIFTPLAVASQFIREANKFGIAAKQAKTQADVAPGITVTNYEKIAHFDLSKFGGVVLDESSILKSFNGKTRTMLIQSCAHIPFRLAATATPSPNDFMELGNHAEFLGIMSYTDMLAMFFVHDGGDTSKWRLKGHAEGVFWRWMCSWAVMLRNPSDLGYDMAGFNLPELNQHQHSVAVEYKPSIETGMLFPLEAKTMSERICARRDTVQDRVRQVFSIVIGSFCDKIDQCHGNLNMPQGGAKNTKATQRSEIDESLNLEAASEIQNTCESITCETLKSINEPHGRKPKSTKKDAIDTPTIQSSENFASNKLDRDAPSLSEKPASNQNTESMHPNMNLLSKGKMDDALFAGASQREIFLLITAMKAAKLEGFFAAHATLELDILKMTQNGLIEPWCIWCNLNSEQDALAKLFGPLAYSVSGSTSESQKESMILDWINGKRPIMISKPSIMGFGMNFQHCRNAIFVGLNDSFEQVYQAIRRFWRFGQTKPVNVHFIAAETEGAMVSNIRRKEADAERMAQAMVSHMSDISSETIRGAKRDRPDYMPTQPVKIPEWI
jgi:hypothetical protein